MKRLWITSIAAMAAILGLSASAKTQELPSAGDVVDLALFIDGTPRNVVLENKQKAKEILIELVGEGRYKEIGEDNLKKLLEAIDRGDATDIDVPAFNGIAGMSSVQFARAVLFTNEERNTRGLIGDFLYDENTMTGHLTVDMKTKIYKNGKLNSTRLLQWHIDVVKDAMAIAVSGTAWTVGSGDGYEVHLRQGDPDNGPFDNPFPNTVIFPDYAIDPTDDRGVWKRGLDHKLFAKGREVVVRDIFKKIDDGPIMRLPNGHVFYELSEESCIDLLTKGKPPAYRIDFPEQSGYCLGRCGSPAVLNSM